MESDIYFFILKSCAQENERAQNEEYVMKAAVAILVGGMILGSVFLDSSRENEKFEETLVVYYFGATDFGFCMVPDNIEKIKKIKTELSEEYGRSKVKFVMVCMDKDVEKGLKFVKKYGYWDEISIGSFYNNELALAALNSSHLPEVPHVMVFKDILSFGKWSLPLRKERTLLVDLAGEEQINEWIQKAYPVPFRNNQTVKK